MLFLATLIEGRDINGRWNNLLNGVCMSECVYFNI